MIRFADNNQLIMRGDYDKHNVTIAKAAARTTNRVVEIIEPDEELKEEQNVSNENKSRV